MKAVLLIFLSFSAMASSQRIYSFGDLMVAFEEVDGFIVNKACDNKKCEAFIKAKKFSKTMPSPAQLEGGKNPSSVRCKTVMSGEVHIGVDREGHEQSACQFKDGSYLLLNFL